MRLVLDFEFEGMIDTKRFVNQRERASKGMKRWVFLLVTSRVRKEKPRRLRGGFENFLSRRFDRRYCFLRIMSRGAVQFCVSANEKEQMMTPRQGRYCMVCNFENGILVPRPAQVLITVETNAVGVKKRVRRPPWSTFSRALSSRFPPREASVMRCVRNVSVADKNKTDVDSWREER